jgi:hypothetical protein
MEKNKEELNEEIPNKVDSSEDVQQQAELTEHSQDSNQEAVEAKEENEAEVKLESEDTSSDEVSEKELSTEATADVDEAEVSDTVEEQQVPIEETSIAAENSDAKDDTEDAAPKVEIASTEEDTEAEEDKDNHEEDDHEEIDFEHFEKAPLVEAIVALKNEEDIRKVDRMIKAMKSRFDVIYGEERQQALEVFMQEEGASEDDFEFKGDELDAKFNDYYDLLRDKRNQYFKNLEQTKEQNLEKKELILDKIRELVDGEETNVSVNALRALQDEWKAVGPIPAAQNRTLWANYHALLDRFYDARSIYFELKELDRKKNYDQKVELCEKAEELANQENVKDAVIHLNELHEEYKTIGPVPRELQEELWQRFKAASDAIYVKRKGFVEELKKELHVNLEKKSELVEKIKEFTSFSSDRITEWNSKTKELLDIQKKWDAIGGLPKDKAKEVNKAFWSTFKQFFNAKNQFFKTLESKKEENLEKKKELVIRAEELKESTEWEKTANALKKLQQEWRDIGPVPDKEKNAIYKQFKSACDQFFEQRRSKSKMEEAEYEKNYQEKLSICDQLEKMASTADIDLDTVYDLIDQYMELGFVPRKVIKKMHARFDAVMESFSQSEYLSDEDKEDLRMQIQVNKLKGSPHGNRKVNRKEQAIRRKIQNIENDINTYKTNIEFFASSKTADKLKEEMNQNIAKAEEELDHLKRQIQMLREA